MTADVGSDGYVVNAYINITGADVSGSLNFALCSADSATTISRNANEGVRLHDLTVGY
jgi:hypothetical protein